MQRERIVKQADRQLEMVEVIKIASLAADDERLSHRFQEEFKRAQTNTSAGFNLLNDEDLFIEDVDLLDNDFSMFANNDESGLRDTEINRLSMPRVSRLSVENNLSLS